MNQKAIIKTFSATDDEVKDLTRLGGGSKSNAIQQFIAFGKYIEENVQGDTLQAKLQRVISILASHKETTKGE